MVDETLDHGSSGLLYWVSSLQTRLIFNAMYWFVHSNWAFVYQLQSLFQLLAVLAFRDLFFAKTSLPFSLLKKQTRQSKMGKKGK